MVVTSVASNPGTDLPPIIETIEPDLTSFNFVNDSFNIIDYDKTDISPTVSNISLSVPNIYQNLILLENLTIEVSNEKDPTITEFDYYPLTIQLNNIPGNTIAQLGDIVINFTPGTSCFEYGFQSLNKVLASS